MAVVGCPGDLGISSDDVNRRTYFTNCQRPERIAPSRARTWPGSMNVDFRIVDYRIVT
jgi:hypothetical protein